MKKIKWKNIIIVFIIFIFIISFFISFFNVIKWYSDSKSTKEQIKKIEKIVDVKEIFDENIENIEIIEQEEEIPEFNPYWDYIKMNLISVSFDELKNINNDTVGWIKVNGTNINYPFVKSSNNEYYLNHSFNKSYNDSGWLFLDYRNNINELNKNTIIYGHGRLEGTMFGTLKNILNSDWINNTNNYIVKLSTEQENTLWQVFSVYRIPTTSDYIKVDFSSNEEFVEWANMLIDRSYYIFNTNVSSNDNVLTLSTCYNENDKIVLHAKLIKKEIR